MRGLWNFLAQNILLFGDYKGENYKRKNKSKLSKGPHINKVTVKFTICE